MTEKSDRLKDKVAIVTGAGTLGGAYGTGQTMSTLFAREGAKVVLADFNVDNANKTLASIESEGGVASIFEMDVTNEADCERCVAATVERYGALDILANNVGGGGGEGKVTEVDADDWDRVHAMNLKSMILMSKYAVPAMAASGGGALVNISSVDGIRAGVWANIPYATAKGGVVALTTHMAVHHGRENVRVNCIAPGMLYSAQMLELYEQEPDIREKRRLGAPLGLEGTPWDIAWAAVFLVSDEARFVSGVTIPVDGGLLAATPLSMRDYMGG